MGQLILKGNEFPIIGNNIVCLPFPTKGHAGLPNVLCHLKSL